MFRKIVLLCCFFLSAGTLFSEEGVKQLTAGSAKVSINPEVFPVIVNGGFLTRTAGAIYKPVYARAFALDNGENKIVLVTIDVCGIETSIANTIRKVASEKTSIPVSNIVVAATHTHTGGAVLAGLGCPIDENYSKLVTERTVEAIVRASRGKVPVKVAWGSTSWPQGTHCRVWITRPDSMLTDPFGERSVRAMMHPGYQNPKYIGPCGPVNSQLALLAFQTLDGKPFAVLGNYGMHYFGSAPVSPDYIGLFCNIMENDLKIDSSKDSAGIVLQFQGTSGDQHWMDYANPPRKDMSIDFYSGQLAEKSKAVLNSLKNYQTWVPVDSRYVVRKMKRRQPDEGRLVWARERVGKMDHSAPRNQLEVYAFETLFVHNEPERDVPLTGMRIGDVGLCFTPCEVYGISGIKLSKSSPFPVQMAIELANGCDGYIPPPEIHPFGGYNTWLGRSAGLVPSAESEIVEQSLKFMEELSGQKRKKYVSADTEYARTVRANKPLAWWRLDNIEGTTCPDSASGSFPGTYMPRTAFYLEGPEFATAANQTVRVPAVHFAEGKLTAKVKGLSNDYAMEAWVWNGLPTDLRAVTGYIFSRAPHNIRNAPGDHLGISGTHAKQKNRLFLFNGNESEHLFGKTELPMKTWIHVKLLRKGNTVSLYVNGKLDAEGEVPRTFNDKEESITIANRNDNFMGLEGKMAEVSLFEK